MELSIIDYIEANKFKYVKIDNSESMLVIHDLFINNIEKNLDDQTDPLIFLYFGVYFAISNNTEKMINYYEKAILLKNNNAYYNLCNFYKRIKDYEKLLKLVLTCGENDMYDYHLNIAVYFKKKILYDKMILCYLSLIKNKNPTAMNNLGQHYSKIKDKENAEKYYLMAIKYGSTKAAKNLAIFYDRNNLMFNKVEYLLHAVNKNKNIKAMILIAKHFSELDLYKNSDTIIKYYNMAIDHDNLDAIKNLAKYYIKINDYENAEVTYLLLKKYNDSDCYFYLAKDFELIDIDRAKKYYRIGIENNNKNCIVGINSLIKKKKNDNFIEFAFEFKDYLNKKNLLKLNIFICKYIQMKKIIDKNLIDVNLIINKKECYVCYNYEHIVNLNCNHFICINCFGQISKCPLCRKKIE